MAIYITQDLYLSGDLSGTDIDPNNPRLGYDSALFDGSVTPEFEEIAHPATNVQNVSTGSYWRSSEDTDAQDFEMQISPKEVDYFGIGGHNLAGATIQLQRREDPADPWIDVGTALIPGDNHAIMIYFEAVYSSSYWNLRITPYAGVAPRIAILYLGKLLTLQRKIWISHKPIIFNKKTKSYTGKGEGGGFHGRHIMSQEHKLNFEQIQTTGEFVRTYVKPWIDVSMERPFFFAWRPSQFPNDIALAWLEDGEDVTPVYKHQSKNMYYSVSANALAPLL